MAQVDLSPLIEQLDDSIDDLEEALAPLLKSALSDTAAKLPLLDRAKLYVLSTYAIESLIFSFLRLNGINAKSHPVFTELTRVKQYFDKIKVAEAGEQKRTLSLNKDAANRIIKHDLAKNNRLDAIANAAIVPVKAAVHTRLSSEVDGKAPNSKTVIATSTQQISKAKEIRDAIVTASKPSPEEAIIEVPKRTQDLADSSSSTKRPREAESSSGSNDEAKPKKSKSKKRKNKKKRKKGLKVAAEEVAAP